MQPPDTFIVLFLVGAYLLPSIIASARHHHNMGAIMVTNLLLGWTAIGWIAAIIWASTAVQQPLKVARLSKQKTCPDCAERVQPEARVCHFCGFDFTPKIATNP